MGRDGESCDQMSQSIATAGVPRKYHHQFVSSPGLADVVFTLEDDAGVLVATGSCTELSSAVYVTASKFSLDVPGNYTAKFESAVAGLWADFPVLCVRKAGAG